MTGQIAEHIVRSNVERFENEFPQDPAYYSNRVSQMASIDLQTITEQDIRNIVEPYLYAWGRMGRVLGRSQYAGWQQKVADQVRVDSSILEHLRTVRLQEAMLDDFRRQVIELYDSFQPIVRYIASAKLLHLICPTFFPLWDNPIANGLRAQYYIGGYSAFSGQDYFEFTHSVQSLLRRYPALWSELSVTYSKGLLRLVDEYFWWAVWRPYSLVI